MPKGHNSGDEVLTSTAQKQLISFIERVENLNVEKAEVAEQIKEVFGEAKGNGFNVKIMRKMIARRAIDAAKRAEEDALLELYEGTCELA